MERMFAGQMRLAAFVVFVALTISLIRGQTPLTNGGVQQGTLPAGGVVAYTFAGAAGQSVQVRVGAASFVPKIDLYASNGLLLGSVPATGPSTSIRDMLLTNTVAAADTYTVKVSSFYAGGSGNFSISFAAIPGAYTVSPADDGGALPNGARVTGGISLGDFDLWTFDGNAGDSIQLRMGATNLVPRIDLYGPDGKLVETQPATGPSTAVRDMTMMRQLPSTGTYTVVASSYYQNNQGGYGLSLAKVPGSFAVAPGDDGGALVNGAFNTGIMDLGDLDMWTIAAKAGDNFQVRMGGTNFVPRLDIYGPDGTLLFTSPPTGPSTALRDTVQAFKAATAGTYTVVASSYYQNTTGGYSISLAQAPADITVTPGDEGGALVNGYRADAFLSLGDLDVWSFTANAGNSIDLRMSGTNLVPRLDLYGPDGTLVETSPPTGPSTALRDTELSASAPASGTYTVVASSYYPNNVGGYSVTLVRIPGDITVAPGDDGGALTNGWLNIASIDIGDLDAWTFSGKAGDSIELRMGATNLAPRIDLYGPDGALIQTAPPNGPSTASRDTELAIRLSADGEYTVVTSAYYPNTTGAYSLTLAQARQPAFAAPGDEGGTMKNGFVYFGTNPLGDLDVFTFYGTPGDSNVFRIGTTNIIPSLTIFGPTGEIVKDSGTLGNVRTNQMSLVITNAGLYTLISEAQNPGQAGTYNLKQSRVPPDIDMPDVIAIDEGQTLNLPITSQDPDDPNKVLAFKLDGAPPGVKLTGVGPTNAIITWATTEADGPSTNTFRVMVTDIVNVSFFTRTNTFTVVVNEVNVAPVLTVPANTTIDELTPLNVSASATDVDIPKNPLTFSLLAPPAGMNIDPGTGAISWTPTEAQGPGTYNIAVVVTDDSPSAVNEKHLSATNTFTVTVREINTQPQFSITNQAIDENKLFTLPVTVTDTDIPPNGESFSVVSGPTGLSIDPATGVISWTPTEAQGPSTNPVTIRVTDSNPDAANNQHLSTDVTFSITVNEVNSPPVLGAIAAKTIDELQTLTVSNAATDSDFPTNTFNYTLVGAPEGATISQAGVITWTPTEAQGPTNVTITTIVTDNGVPPLSATNTFTVTVNEVNTAPVLTTIGAQTIDELQTLTVNNGATDSDLPANALTYKLVNPPAGVSISPTGVITWTPSEAQGPTNVTITTIVTDNGTPALSATNSFNVTVNEVNLPPVIADIPDQSVHFGTTLTLQTTVTDPDLPTNSITLSLENAPKGMTLDSSTGTITWTPAEADLGVYTVTLHATDNGSPVQSSSKTFQVTVTGSGAHIDVKMVSDTLIELDITADAGHTYEIQKATDLPNWQTLVQFPLTTGTHQYIEPITDARRFYRLKLIQ